MKNSKVCSSKIWSFFAGASLAVLVPVSAYAQGVLESVVSSVQNGVDVVRIDFGQPLAELPRGFAVQTPPRVALDFPGTVNGSGKNIFEINQGNVRSVNIVQAGDLSRIVLNLKQATSYQAEIQGKSLFISLGSSGSIASAAAKG
ncbi:MAG: AMIN domain-containing protein, partial [Proteobacteria bacterium]